MRFIIRQMREQDIERVRELDALAFTAYAKSEVAPRTHENIRASMALNPSGCFIAECGGNVEGFIFSRRWGDIGWIGTFGVNPRQQGKGIGKSLIQKAIRRLQLSRCKCIGLETMADSAYNIGMYSKLGFCLTFPTLVLTKDLSRPKHTGSWHATGNISAVSSLSRLSNSFLDLAPESLNAEKYGWGETIFFGNSKPYGLAIVRNKPIREKFDPKLGIVMAMAIKSKDPDIFKRAIDSLESYAFSKSHIKMLIPINALNPAIHELFAGGYKLNRVSCRMVYKGLGYTDTAGFTFERWAM